MRSDRAVVSAAFAVIVFSPLFAWANGVELPDTVNVALRPGSTTEVGLEANFGWLSAPDGVSWSWVCHDVILDPTSSLTPMFFLGQDATLVSARALGVARDPIYSVYRSTDSCNWSPPADLANVNVREVAFDPGTPAHVLAATFTGGDTATNGVWESDDAGATWHKTSLDLAARFFRSVEFAAADPQRVYATASYFQPAPSAWLYVSDDGGDSWAEIPWVFSVNSTLQGNVDVVAVSPSDADIAYARTNGGTDYLLRTTNGGLAWEVVFSVTDDIRGVVHDSSGAMWAATIYNGIWRATDGKTFVEIPPSAATPEAPAARGLGADSRGVFVAANNYFDGFAIGLTEDLGESYSPLFRFVELTGTRPCPSGSDVAVICEPQWPAISQLLGITTPTPTPTPPSGDDDDDGGGTGCACSFASGTSAMAPGVIALVSLAGAFFRRRRWSDSNRTRNA